MAMPKTTLSSAVFIAALTLVAACGKPAEERRTEEAAKAVEKAGKQVAEAGKQAEKGAEDMAKGLEAMAKGLAGLAGQTADGKPVNPVSFRDLQAFFPQVSGWEMGKPTGERMTAPVTFSKAEVSYTKGDSRVDATITDTALNGLLMMPFTMVMSAGYERETSSGYEKATKVAGHPALEKWNSEGRDGEITAIVNKRFLVQFDGSGIDDPKVLHQFAEATDFAKLAAVK